MNKYKRLTRNTTIFLLGDAGSKLAAFFMLRYYTGVLTTSEYGIIDLIVTTATFLMPTITLAINESVFRFSMDRDIERSQVITIGIAITLIGNFVLLLLVSLVHLPYDFWNYRMLIWLVCITSGIRAILSSYCRGIEKVKLYAISGIIQSFLQIGIAVVLISVFQMGLRGYIYAAASASLLTSLIIVIGIRKELRFNFHIDPAIGKQMLVYSIPLIIHLISWWAMSSIDKYVILSQLTTADNGMFSAAGKVPALLTTVNAVFFKAWQLSSVAESNSADKAEFYSKIFHLLHITLTLVSMVLLLLIRPIYAVMVGPAFEGSWQYTPFLVISVVFSCFASFMGTNYVAMKKTKGAVYTSGSAALINLGLNIVLTRHFGITGTAFATMISYILLWIFIMLNTSHFVSIRIQYPKFIATHILLLAQAFLIASGQMLYIVQAVLIIIVVWMNANDIKQIFHRMLFHLRKTE